MTDRRAIEVVAPTRGKDGFSFEYDDGWRSLPPPLRVAIDPALEIGRGLRFVPSGQRNFGVFLDASPYRRGPGTTPSSADGSNAPLPARGFTSPPR